MKYWITFTGIRLVTLIYEVLENDTLWAIGTRLVLSLLVSAVVWKLYGRIFVLDSGVGDNGSFHSDLPEGAAGEGCTVRHCSVADRFGGVVDKREGICYN